MGDSFTEGIGVPFDQTFAGLLYRDGLESVDKAEFLNAAVAGYSPVIYYRKIQHLLESGLRFDEVVVFPDQSDVADEATHFFCVDEDPRYDAYCAREASEEMRKAKRPPYFLARNFIVADRIRQTVKEAIHRWRHPVPERKGIWMLPGRKAERLGWSMAGMLHPMQPACQVLLHRMMATACFIRCNIAAMAKRFPARKHRRRTFIRQWRKHRGLSQERLADRLGMSKAQLSRIENGEQPYAQDFLEACAEALQTEPASLLTRDPGDPEAIWSVWDRAKPGERRQIVEIAKTLIKGGT